MFPSLMNRQPLALKLMVVVVLCVFCAISWHVFAAQHTDHVRVTEQCKVCNWVRAVVCIAASVSFLCALSPIQRAVFFVWLFSPILYSHRPSGRSPPRR